MTVERSRRDRSALPQRTQAAAEEGADVSARVPRPGYTPPRLIVLGCTDDLLEVLGPAQANYGLP